MKNTRAVVMVIVSVLLGVVAVVVAGRWVTEQAAVDTAKVIVASRDLDVGTRLTPDLLQPVDWPRGSAPDGAFNDPKLLDTRVVKVNLLRGEPVLEAKLAPLGTQGGLSAVIGEGKRAITVRVNDVIGVAGFALPGNLVDILVSTQDDSGKPISKIVLEQILVLAVAQDVGRDETKAKVVNAVTLEVTPEQAEKLDLARSIGSLSLVLRNQIDKSPASTEGARRKDVLKKLVAEPEAKPAAPQVVTKTEVKRVVVYRDRPAVVAPKQRVEIIKGTQRSSTELEGESK